MSSQVSTFAPCSNNDNLDTCLDAHCESLEIVLAASVCLDWCATHSHRNGRRATQWRCVPAEARPRPLPSDESLHPSPPPPRRCPRERQPLLTLLCPPCPPPPLPPFSLPMLPVRPSVHSLRWWAVGGRGRRGRRVCLAPFPSAPCVGWLSLFCGVAFPLVGWGCPAVAAPAGPPVGGAVEVVVGAAGAVGAVVAAAGAASAAAAAVGGAAATPPPPRPAGAVPTLWRAATPPPPATATGELLLPTEDTDGEGQFDTDQGAADALPKSAANTARWTRQSGSLIQP